jgi:ribonuclease HI
VLARCDDSGTLIAEDGRVEIRYRAKDSRAYRAALRNLVASDTAILPDDTCVPAAESDGARGRPTRSGRNTSPNVAANSAALPEGAVIVYADGACSGNPGPAGAGIVLIEGKSRRELSEYLGEGTNNIAELMAIHLAAESITDADKPVRIHTDSQYSIGVLTKGWKAKANVELIARVRAGLKRFSNLQLIYVRGHSGVVLNERADVLAVEAVQRRGSSGWVQVTE